MNEIVIPPPSDDDWDRAFSSCDWGHCDNQATGLGWSARDKAWLPCCESCGDQIAVWIPAE